jgi:cell division protein FtsW (lipid II flippase)
MLITILLVFAFVLFFLAVISSAVDPWYRRLIAAGLAAWSLAEIFVRSGVLGR